MIRALVADDEPLGRESLRSLLAGEVDVELIAEARDGIEALRLIDERQPDLVFLDVAMPGKSGFDVLAGLERIMPVAVFVTAYDRYALQAFEAHAIDYLLKPVAPQRFRETMIRVRQHLRGAERAQAGGRLEALLHEQSGEGVYLGRFLVRAGERLRIVPIASVDWIKAAGNYARLSAGGERHSIRETMRHLESALDPARFLRIHRSYVVNIDRVRDVRIRRKGEYAVILHDGTRLPLSRRYRRRLVDRLGRIA